MKEIYYRVLNINGGTIVECNTLKDAVEFCHKFNSMLDHKGCKVVKVIKKGK